MRTTLCAALVLACSAAVLTAQESARNLGFEDDQPGSPPSGWSVDENAPPNERAAVTDETPYAGRRCFGIRHEGTDATGGGLGQRIAAESWRGKVIRFRAAARMEGKEPASRAQLWLRVDRPGGELGFFDNMHDRPIRDPNWATYGIEGRVAADAESIHFGFFLVGRGRAFLDDVELEVVDVAADPPRQLAGRALANLIAFAKLFGYVRYFHPSDQAAEADWEKLAIAGVRAAEPAESVTELASILDALFRPIAPTIQVVPSDGAPTKSDGLTLPVSADRVWVRAWHHRGVGTGDPKSRYSSARSKKRVKDGKLPEGCRAPADAFVAELGGGVVASVPTSLFADEDGTLPRAPEPPAESLPSSFPLSGDDRATRLADVVLAWNVFQHFYPYFDVVGTDWSKELETALTAAAEDTSEREFLDTLRRLAAALDDGHGGVYHENDVDVSFPAFAWDWVEGALVISHVGAGAPADLERGSIVLAIDGIPVAEAFVREASRISSATEQWLRRRSLRALASGPPGSELTLALRSPSGEMRAFACARAATPGRLLEEPRPDKVTQIEPGIFYLDLDRISDEDFDSALPDLEQARGIVFDLRGYPSKLSTVVLAHLIDEPIQCARWNVPVVTLPDRQGWEFAESRWSVKPIAPRLHAKAAFITDGRAISYAETYLGMVEHYELAEIVGGPTAGTNGDVNPFELPGGYQISWTGMRVLKHDGSRHHGVGIQPTVPCSRMIEGVAAGRDELLERAVQVVKD